MKLKHPYTRIANKILKKLYTTNLSGQEIRVFLYILRYTYGMKGKKKTHLKVNQMAKDVNIGYSRCSRVVNQLQKRKMIFTNYNGRGNIKEWGVNKDVNEWEDIVINSKVVCHKQQSSLSKTANSIYKKRNSVKKECKERQEGFALSDEYFSISEKEKKEYKHLNTLLQTKLNFSLYAFNIRFKNKKGYFPSPKAVINVSKSALKTKPNNLWGYFLIGIQKANEKAFSEKHEKESEQRHKTRGGEINTEIMSQIKIKEV